MFLPTAREGNVFRSVCQSFCSQGGGGLPSGQRPQTDRDPPGQRSPPPPPVATAAVNTHPTGMHSCCMDCFHTGCFHMGCFGMGCFCMGCFCVGCFHLGCFCIECESLNQIFSVSIGSFSCVHFKVQLVRWACLLILKCYTFLHVWKERNIYVKSRVLSHPSWFMGTKSGACVTRTNQKELYFSRHFFRWFLSHY